MKDWISSGSLKYKAGAQLFTSTNSVAGSTIATHHPAARVHPSDLCGLLRSKPQPNRNTTGRPGDMFMTDNRVRSGEKQEDQFTALLESQSASLPSSLFLGAAIASIIGSLSFKLAGKDHQALFVGQWAAPFLLLGIYNKMVKQHGSDAVSR
jgi:hypothetical protein